MPGDLYDVDNSTGFQIFLPNGRYSQRPAYPASDAAVRDTAGQYLYEAADQARRPIKAEFSSDHHPNNSPPYRTQSGGFPYLRSVADPITNGEDRHGDEGHGRGLSQQGARKWERGRNSDGDQFPAWDTARTLAHYYTGANLWTPTIPARWPAHRWNALTLSTTRFRTDAAVGVDVWVQNSGSASLPAGSRLVVSWERCDALRQICAPHDQIAEDTIPFPSGGLTAGEDARALLFLRPPSGLYQGSSGYSYQQVWDTRLPSGQLLSADGWPVQYWPVSIHTPPPTPRPLPSPCGGPPDAFCPLNMAAPTVAWGASEHNDPVVYRWERSGPQGERLSGTTSRTDAAIPLLRGDNRITVRAQDAGWDAVSSDAVLVARLRYDPDPPALVFTAPPWTNATALTLSWSGSDALSGLSGYTLERQVNGGTWSTLVNGPATSYMMSGLADGSDYGFRVTARDAAGNTAVQAQVVRVDRVPPNSQLHSPSGALATSWAVLRWLGTDNRAGVAAYQLQVQIDGGAWQAWGGTVSGTPTLVFAGQPRTRYAWRIRAIDRASNVEPAHPSADISFSTGAARQGLAQLFLPLVMH